MSTRGFFLTLDGPSGVGKSTILTHLADQIRARGRAVHTTAEPTTTTLGQFTRAHADQLHGHALACLVAADRYEHTTQLRTLLADGVVVLCDRYLASSLVLQHLDGVPHQFLLNLNADVLRPDLAVILTAAPETITRRLDCRGRRHRFHDDRHTPVREVALYRTARRILHDHHVPTLLLDCTTSAPHQVTHRIADILFEQWL
jgi:dTMP kinase